MKHAKPLTDAFDWERARQAQEHVVSSDGTVNWRAAFAADPGVTECPGCKESVWAEADVMRCDCGSLCGREIVEMLRRAREESK